MSEKSILITGCSSGLGFDAAVTLHDQGWQVLATCRQARDVEKLRTMGLTSYVLDYADQNSVEDGAKQALDLTDGKLFALYNNGAFASPGAIEDLPREAMRDIFETNVFGQFELARLLLPAMKTNGRGRIINNSSVLGYVVRPYNGAYSGTKFAMEALTDAMRMENRESPIEIILIEPGPIPSRIRVNSRSHFSKHVDWENSAFRSTYEDIVRPAIFDQDNAPSRLERPVSHATDVLIRALTDKRPQPRYHATLVPSIVLTLRRFMTTRMMDAILGRQKSKGRKDGN